MIVANWLFFFLLMKLLCIPKFVGSPMFVLAAGKLAQFPWGIRDDINLLLFEWIPQCDRQLFVYIRFTLFASFIYNTTTLDSSYHKFKLSIQLIKMHTIDFARKTVSTINAMQTSRKAAMFCFRLPNVFALSRQGYSGQVLNSSRLSWLFEFFCSPYTHTLALTIFSGLYKKTWRILAQNGKMNNQTISGEKAWLVWEKQNNNTDEPQKKRSTTVTIDVWYGCDRISQKKNGRLICVMLLTRQKDISQKTFDWTSACTTNTTKKKMRRRHKSRAKTDGKNIKVFGLIGAHTIHTALSFESN